MTDRLSEKLRGLRQLHMDADRLWARIEEGPREPQRPARERIITVVVAVALSTAAVGVAWNALRPQAATAPATSSTPSIPTTPAPSRVAEVVCSSTGTHVLTPIVEVQRDGVHLRVDNEATAEGLDVFPAPWDGGVMSEGLPEGTTEVVFGTPPGDAQVACVPRGGGPRGDSLDELQNAVPIEIQDPAQLWRSNLLACGPTERQVHDNAAFRAPQGQDVQAAIRAIIPGVEATDTVERAGYPEEQLPGGRMDWRVVRNGNVVAVIDVHPSTDSWILSPVQSCRGSAIGAG